MFTAERIYEIREEKGITRKELAQGIHVSRSSITEYEKGDTQPSLSALLQLADFFDVSLDYLMGRTDIKVSPNTLREQHELFLQLNPKEKEILEVMLKSYIENR